MKSCATCYRFKDGFCVKGLCRTIDVPVLAQDCCSEHETKEDLRYHVKNIGMFKVDSNYKDERYIKNRS